MVSNHTLRRYFTTSKMATRHNTTIILVEMAKRANQTHNVNEISNMTGLPKIKVREAIRFLRDKKYVKSEIVPLKRIPYRIAYYKINPNKEKKIIRLLMRDGYI